MEKIFNKLINPQASFSFEWRVLSPILFICSIGLLLLKSTSIETAFIDSTFYKQLIWISIGCILLFIIQFVKLQFFNEYAYHIYFCLIMLLIMTYFMPSIGGANRWIKLGHISFQPSELGKIITIFVISKFLSDQHENINNIKVLIITFLLAIVPALIVFKQPDLGTAIIYLSITFPMLYWTGIRPFYLFLIIAPLFSIVTAFHIYSFFIWMAVLIIILFICQPKILQAVWVFVLNTTCGLLAPYLWDNVLYHHQRERILTFLDPLKDPQGAGYQIIQSMTAIGSGGVWGKGFGKGTQTHLRYLPVRDTDFIISVAGEELGIFGIFSILVLFAIFIYWVLIYAQKVSNHFSSLVMIGITTVLFVHILINMGMTVGLFPVTGLPAPFISYGGSFTLTCFTMVAIIINMINKDI